MEEIGCLLALGGATSRHMIIEPRSHTYGYRVQSIIDVLFRQVTVYISPLTDAHSLRRHNQHVAMDTSMLVELT